MVAVMVALAELIMLVLLLVEVPLVRQVGVEEATEAGVQKAMGGTEPEAKLESFHGR